MPLVRGVTVGVAMMTLAACTVTSTGPSPSPTLDTPSSTTNVATPGTEPGTGGTLRFALGANPVTIDPRFLDDQEGTTVVDALFDSLVALDDDLVTVVPAAATDWQVSDDGLTYTFELRADATFHDGSPVEARDFVRAFRRIVDREAAPTSFLHHQLAPVEGYDAAVTEGRPLSGVRAVDPTTLRIQLSRPAAEFLQVLAHPSLAPIPAAADEDPDAFAEQPVGNGPFVMAEAWQPNQFIRVVRFPDHPAPPRLDEVVFQIFANDASRQQQFNDFQRGQVDVAEIPPANLDEAVSTYGRAADGFAGQGVLSGLTGVLYAYGFNTELAPFDDPAVRRAISLLIDRDRIVQQILLDARVAATTLVPPSLPGAEAGRCRHCRYDPDGARAELGLQSAAPPGTATPTETPTARPSFEQPIEIVVNAGATNEQIAARIATDIRAALGVEVRTRTAEPAAFVGELRAGEVQVFRLAWQADHPSPGAVLQPLFRSDAIGQDNLTRFTDTDVDALLDQARSTSDPELRHDLYGQAEERILELAPVAPIFFYPQNRVVADTVEGLRMGPLGTVNLSDVWKQPLA